MARSQPVAPDWSARVPRRKIARLYADDARGLRDDDLIDDVAYTLLARCESMLVANRAHAGLAACPLCGKGIAHPGERGRTLVCGCGWSGAWDDYWRSYKGRHLLAPGLEPFLRRYVAALPALRGAREKILWIDWLIHRFHWQGIRGALGQSGGASLIEGRAHRVNAFLDALTAGTNDPALQASTRAWREDQRLRVETFEHNAEARKQARTEA